MIDPKKTPRYVTTTEGASGHFAVLVWWNPEMGGFWEPWDTGFGRYASLEDAVEEAKQWAEEERLPFVPQDDSTK